MASALKIKCPTLYKITYSAFQHMQNGSLLRSPYTAAEETSKMAATPFYSPSTNKFRENPECGLFRNS